jgi:hypothetical protein
MEREKENKACQEGFRVTILYGAAANSDKYRCGQTPEPRTLFPSSKKPCETLLCAYVRELCLFRKRYLKQRYRCTAVHFKPERHRSKDAQKTQEVARRSSNGKKPPQLRLRSVIQN